VYDCLVPKKEERAAKSIAALQVQNEKSNILTNSYCLLFNYNTEITKRIPLYIFED